MKVEVNIQINLDNVFQAQACEVYKGIITFRVFFITDTIQNLKKLRNVKM